MALPPGGRGGFSRLPRGNRNRAASVTVTCPVAVAGNLLTALRHRHRYAKGTRQKGRDSVQGRCAIGIRILLMPIFLSPCASNVGGNQRWCWLGDVESVRSSLSDGRFGARAKRFRQHSGLVVFRPGERYRHGLLSPGRRLVIGIAQWFHLDARPGPCLGFRPGNTRPRAGCVAVGRVSDRVAAKAQSSGSVTRGARGPAVFVPGSSFGCRKRMTLAAEDFIDRLPWHLPEPCQYFVRTAGLYATRGHSERNQARHALGRRQS